MINWINGYDHKDGQSPLNTSQLQRIDDGPTIAGVNAVWAVDHPSEPDHPDVFGIAQVAPTILKLLGLDPGQLQAVQREGTQVLPGVGNR